MSGKAIAGLSLKGGRKDNSFLCILTPHADRWFLEALVPIKDEADQSPDEALKALLRKHPLDDLVVDFPLSSAPCQDCTLVCPGALVCPVDGVVEARARMEGLLELDQAVLKEGPKAYENRRLQMDEVQHNRSVLIKETEAPLLSKPFKRRLKKGLLPYWNRPLDVWVWTQYYDQMLELFNVSYDSFGQAPYMVVSRMGYLRRHFPQHLKSYEANIYVTFVELLRAKLVLQKDLMLLADYIQAPEARLDVLKRLDEALGIFVYGQDMEILIANPSAFDSFILAVAGKQRAIGRARALPEWAGGEAPAFIAPIF